MLKPTNRLKKRRDFQRVYRRGRRFFSPLMVIQWAPRETPATPSRFGIVISNKISKKALKKNKAKRLLRESLRHLIQSGGVVGGFDFVVSGKKEILEADYDHIEKTIQQFFQQGAAKTPPAPPKRTSYAR